MFNYPNFWSYSLPFHIVFCYYICLPGIEMEHPWAKLCNRGKLMESGTEAVLIPEGKGREYAPTHMGMDETDTRYELGIV
jgi:hypothetical protein